MDKELENMVRLDLRDYLAGDGYTLDERESTKDSFKMRGPHGVLILRVRDDGVWEYFSPHDENDHGTIVQYLQRRRGAGFTLGHVKHHLRPKVGRLLPVVPKGPRPVGAAPRDLSLVAKRWSESRAVWGLPHYLATRGIAAEVVAAYASALRMDKKGNVLFGHSNEEGQIVGYEIKGPQFFGFSKGGIRLLCRLGPLDGTEPAKIALTESGLDALSLAEITGRRDTLFASTGGALSPHTINAIKATAARFPAAEVLLAFDADDGGRMFAEQVERALLGREGVRRVVPKAKDWNAQIQAAKARPPSPS